MTSFVIREMQVKTAMRDHLTSKRMFSYKYSRLKKLNKHENTSLIGFLIQK